MWRVCAQRFVSHETVLDLLLLVLLCLHFVRRQHAVE
jgi:hypothetical protein